MASKVKAASKKTIGRPRTGRRSNDAYRQTSLWLRKETLTKALQVLVSPEGKRIEFSALVQSLMDDWLTKGAKIPKDL